MNYLKFLFLNQLLFYLQSLEFLLYDYESLTEKSSVNVLPVGDPPKVNIASTFRSYYLKYLIHHLTLPVPPEPVVIIDTEKSSSVCDTKVSFVPGL